jgi:hypothetical protein
MLSNGEIYHMALNIHEEFMKKHLQVPIVELRDYIKAQNRQDIQRPEMEEKAREWARKKTGK